MDRRKINYTLHISIVDCMSEFLGNTLSASEHRGVVMKEINPMVYIGPKGFLVTDVSNNDRLACLTKLYDTTQRVLHGDAKRTHTLADIKIEAVESLIFDRMINLSTTGFRSNPKRHRRYPLPIAEMTQIERYGATILNHTINLIHVGEYHPALHKS